MSFFKRATAANAEDTVITVSAVTVESNSTANLLSSTPILRVVRFRW